MCIQYEYELGDVVFLKIEAKRGEIRPLTVQRIFIKSENDSFGVHYRLDNGFWHREEELTNEHEALGMAARYHRAQSSKFFTMQNEVWARIEEERWKRIRKMEEDSCGDC